MIAILRKPEQDTPHFEFPCSIVPADYEPCASATAKLADLEQELKRLRSRRNELEDSLRAHRADGTIAAARALLDGGDGVPPVSSARAEHLEVQRQIPVLEAAIKEQETRVRAATNVVSQRIAAEVAPEYRDLLSRMAEVAVELGRLADQERDCRERLMAHGVAFTGKMPAAPLTPMELNTVGSRLNVWLDNLEIDHGIHTGAARPGAGGRARSR